MQFDKQILSAAITQVFGLNVSLNDEQTGARWFKAIEKARTALATNKTIRFDGQKLTFVSQDSNESRIVTKDGCVKDSCPCTDSISYHKALFQIVSTYKQMEAEADRLEFVNGGIRAIFTRQPDGKFKQTAEYVAGVRVWLDAPKSQKYAF